MHPAVRFLAAGLFTLTVLANTPARAQVDEAGAEKLRAEIDTYFEILGAASGGMLGAGGVSSSYDVTVTPEGDHYRVEYENLSIGAPEGIRLLYGDQTLSFSPLEGGLYRLSDLEVDDTWLYLGPGGETIAELSLTNLTLDAIVDLATGAYTEGGMRADRIEVYAPEDKGTRFIFENAEYVTEDYSYVDGVVGMTLVLRGQNAEVHAAVDSDSDTVHIASFDAIEMRSGVEAFDMNAFREYAADPASENGTLANVFSFYDGLMSYGLSLDGLRVMTPYAEVALSEAELFFDAEVTSEPTTGGDLSILLAGLAIQSPALAAQGMDDRLIPNSVTLQLSLDRVPTAPFAEYIDSVGSYVNSVQEAQAGGDAEPPESVMGEAGMDAFSQLAASDARLTIEKFIVETRAASITASGEAQVEPQSLYGATAALTAELLGAQALQAAAQEMAASGNPNAVETAQGLLAGLGMMMAFSQGPETPPPSVPEALSYLLRLLPDGAVTVNGIPVIPAPSQEQEQQEPQQ